MSHSQIKKGRATVEAASASELQLKEWLRACDREGALPAAEAAVDLAYAQGYKKGIEEGRADHLDAMRTLLMRALEAKFDSIEDTVLERIGEADLKTLEHWLFDLFHADSLQQALGT